MEKEGESLLGPKGSRRLFLLGMDLAIYGGKELIVLNNLDRKVLDLVKKDTVLALGCTEPIAVALCSSRLRGMVDNIERIELDLSLNIYKNGKAVYIPGTGRTGLDFACALGLVGGDYRKGLMVLEDIRDEDIEKALELVDSGLIKLRISEEEGVYVKVKLIGDGEALAVVESSHDSFSHVEENSRIIFSQDPGKDSNNMDFLYDLDFIKIREIVEATRSADLTFLREGIEKNLEAAKEGLKGETYLGIGKSLVEIYGDKPGLIDRVRIYTASASDFRMSGGNCPIMTSGGSGNQGIGVFIPIALVAEEKKLDEDKLLRAIYFGHIVNKYVKLYTGKLSSLCGCAIASALGAASGITWMLGGSDEEIAGSCNNLLSNLTGMICDGAKDTCALKLATSATEALIASFLSLDGVYPKGHVGIVSENVVDSIKNLGILREEGLRDADSTIVKLI